MPKSTPIQIPLPLEETVFTISLTKGQVTIVDAVDADLGQYKWHSQINRNYASGEKFTARNSDCVSIHCVILERMIGRPLFSGEKVDHIDLDTLNNRRSNLRLASNSQNLSNRHKPISNTSGYKGVTFHQQTGKWRARIGYQNKVIYLGLFDTPQDAHKAYCLKAVELFGEFARFE